MFTREGNADEAINMPAKNHNTRFAITSLSWLIKTFSYRFLKHDLDFHISNRSSTLPN
jgi:hypothetical protein